MAKIIETPDYYTLGRGILRVRKDAEASWLDLMHVKDVKINITADELEHENVRSGLKVVDKTITTKMTAKGSFMCDVPIVENIALFLMSTGITDVAQTSGTWTAEEFTVEVPDQWHELGKKDIVATAVTDDAGTPVALVEGTDYEVDWSRGLFRPLSTSSLVGAVGDKYKITATYPDKTIKRIHAAQATIKRHVWFTGSPATGRIIDIRGFCNLKPNGDLSLSADEWMGFSFDMSFNKHSDYPLSPVGLYWEDNGEVASE